MEGNDLSEDPGFVLIRGENHNRLRWVDGKERLEEIRVPGE